MGVLKLMTEMLGGSRLNLSLVGGVMCHGLGACFERVDLLQVGLGLVREAGLVAGLPLLDLLKPELVGLCVGFPSVSLSPLVLASALELVDEVGIVEELAASLLELVNDVLVGGRC